MTSTDPGQIARWFHALSDETRVRIIDLLRAGECCVCELQEPVGAAQSRLSFHLKVLREAGIVQDRKEGRWNFYSLRADVLDRMAAYLVELPTAAVGSDHCGSDAGRDSSCCE